VEGHRQHSTCSQVCIINPTCKLDSNALRPQLQQQHHHQLQVKEDNVFPRCRSRSSLLPEHVTAHWQCMQTAASAAEVMMCVHASATCRQQAVPKCLWPASCAEPDWQALQRLRGAHAAWMTAPHETQTSAAWRSWGNAAALVDAGTAPSSACCCGTCDGRSLLLLTCPSYGWASAGQTTWTQAAQ
jgi:hypothetical protein